MDRREAARLLGSLPKSRRYEVICPICGRSFKATSRARFCSSACRWTYHNRQKAKTPLGRGLLDQEAEANQGQGMPPADSPPR